MPAYLQLRLWSAVISVPRCRQYSVYVWRLWYAMGETSCDAGT